VVQPATDRFEGNTEIPVTTIPNLSPRQIGVSAPPQHERARSDQREREAQRQGPRRAEALWHVKPHAGMRCPSWGAARWVRPLLRREGPGGARRRLVLAWL
jgi:hypothetical protein